MTQQFVQFALPGWIQMDAVAIIFIHIQFKAEDLHAADLSLFDKGFLPPVASRH